MTRVRSITQILKDVDDSTDNLIIKGFKEELIENRFYYKEYQYSFANEHIDNKLSLLQQSKACHLSFPS